MDWTRFAAKLGVVLTDPRVRADIQDSVKTRVDHVADTFNKKYEEASNRFEAAGSALRGEDRWPSKVVGFLLGVGVGAGLGLLLAPASGTETREAIRDKAVEMKDRVAQSVSATSSQVRRSVSSMPSTGTEG